MFQQLGKASYIHLSLKIFLEVIMMSTLNLGKLRLRKTNWPHPVHIHLISVVLKIITQLADPNLLTVSTTGLKEAQIIGRHGKNPENDAEMVKAQRL